MKNISLIICYCVALLLTGSPAVAGISASLTNTQLRATPVSVSVSGTAAVSGPVTDAQLRATPVPVSGAVTVSGTVTASGPLTDAQLRAADVSVKENPQTSGGLSVYHRISVASGSPAVVKASPGQVYGWAIYNTSSGPLRLTFHNSASAPTPGAAVFFTFAVPAGGSASFSSAIGIAFSAGIGITVVDDSGATIADSDSSAPNAGNSSVDIFYK